MKCELAGSTFKHFNDQAADLCDWLMGRGESYDHVHFDTIRSFDEWMRVEKMPLINSYLVIA